MFQALALLCSDEGLMLETSANTLYIIPLPTLLAVPSSMGSCKSLTNTSFFSMQPSISRAGFSSDSGSSVSTVVLAIAKKTLFGVTELVWDTRVTYMSENSSEMSHK